MNTILTILLLIALAINIVCDIVRVWMFCKAIEQNKQNIEETICDAIDRAYYDWTHDADSILDIHEYFRKNFDKYL